MELQAQTCGGVRECKLELETVGATVKIGNGPGKTSDALRGRPFVIGETDQAAVLTMPAVLLPGKIFLPSMSIAMSILNLSDHFGERGILREHASHRQELIK